MNLDQFIFPGDYIQKTLLDVDQKVLMGGKNLRRKLMYAFGNDLGVELEILEHMANIGELVHNATLAHDDVIDEGKIRRGVDSLPVQIGNRESVLAGDYMLARAMYELAQFQNPQLIQELAEILKNLVDGELLQLACIDDGMFSLNEWSTIARKKTGSLITWSLIAPAIISDHDLDLNLLKEAASHLGEAYQILDDSIDAGLLTDKKSIAVDQFNHLDNFIDLTFKNLPTISKHEKIKMIYLQVDQRAEVVLNIFNDIAKSLNLNFNLTNTGIRNILERNL
jgi:geranylgeranyl pyrophosphate synthase